MVNPDTIQKKFVGFYSANPFWVGTKPNLDFSYLTGNQIMNKDKDLLTKVEYLWEKNGYELRFCKDGLVLLGLFDCIDLVKDLYEKAKPKQSEEIFKWSIYLNYLNAIYLLLDSAVIKEMNLAYFNQLREITDMDAFTITFEDGKIVGESVPHTSIASVYQMDRMSTFYNPSSYSRFLMRYELNEPVFKTVLSDFEKIYANYEHIKTLANITKSLSEFKIASFSTSLVLSWFVIESYLNLYWDRFLEEKKKNGKGELRINKKRRKDVFGDTKSYPASVILNILEVSGYIETDIFNKIDDVRKYRNDIVHQNSKYVCTSHQCWEAFEIITYFVEKEMGLDLKINSSLTYSGI
jgi:hypothetical protein